MAFLSRVGNALKQTLSKNINSGLSANNPSIFQAVRYMSGSKIFIGGLSYNTDDQSLRESFTSFGEVIEARVIQDRETGRSRGFGFVSFTSSEEASKAIQAMDGKDLHGRIVRVNYANERTGGYRSGGGGGYGGGGYGAGGGGYGGGDGGYGGNTGGYGAGGGGYGGNTGGYGAGGGGYGGNSGGYEGNSGGYVGGSYGGNTGNYGGDSGSYGSANYGASGAGDSYASGGSNYGSGVSSGAGGNAYNTGSSFDGTGAGYGGSSVPPGGASDNFVSGGATSETGYATGGTFSGSTGVPFDNSPYTSQDDSFGMKDADDQPADLADRRG